LVVDRSRGDFPLYCFFVQHHYKSSIRSLSFVENRKSDSVSASKDELSRSSCDTSGDFQEHSLSMDDRAIEGFRCVSSFWFPNIDYDCFLVALGFFPAMVQYPFSLRFSFAKIP